MTGYLLDGVSNRRNVFGDLVGGAFPVSLEAIREFEVVNNAYDVTSGRGGGSIIKAVTKSGTNQFHGSAFGYYSGDFLTGDRFIRENNVGRTTPSGDFTISQYGVSLSGPIIKNKLHFFATADRYAIVSPYNVEDFEPAGATPAEAEKNWASPRPTLTRSSASWKVPRSGCRVPRTASSMAPFSRLTIHSTCLPASTGRSAPYIGEVDAMTVNHHGNRDGTNVQYLRTLKPRVIVQEVWSSDHPGHEVLRRLTSKWVYPGERDLFATNLLEANKQVIGPELTNAYRSYEGHVVIRVAPGGEQYQVHVLNHRSRKRELLKTFGPYLSK